MASKTEDDKARKERRLLNAMYVLLGLVFVFEPINALVYGIDLHRAVTTFQWGEPVSWLSLVFNCAWPLGFLWVLRAGQRGRLTGVEVVMLIFGGKFAMDAVESIFEPEPKWASVGLAGVLAAVFFGLALVEWRQRTKGDAAKANAPTEDAR